MAITKRAAVRQNCRVVLPPEVRRALHVAEGDEIEFAIDDAGDVSVRGMRVIPTDQAWFWTEEWQEGEREIDEARARGEDRGQVMTEEEFLEALRSDFGTAS